MLTFTEFLKEALLTEANKDSRRNPPKFTPSEIKLNKKLFQHVGYAIAKAAAEDKNKDWFTDIPGVTFKSILPIFVGKVAFVPSYNIKANAYYRNAIEGAFEHDGVPSNVWNDSLYIELLTDSVNNTVSIIARGNKLKYQGFVDVVYTAIEIALKKIAEQVKRSKVDSGQQYGYSWKLINPDYSKCESHSEIRSALSQRSGDGEKHRQEDERASYQTSVKSSQRRSEVYSKRSEQSQQVASKIKSTKAFKLIERIAEKHDFTLAGFDQWRLGYYLKDWKVAVDCEIRVHDNQSGDFYQLTAILESYGARGHLTELITPSKTTIADLYDIVDKLNNHAYITINGERSYGYGITSRIGKIKIKEDGTWYSKGNVNYTVRIPRNVSLLAKELSNELEKLTLNSFPKLENRRSSY